MLNTITPEAAIAVSDLGRARAFYEGLGFSVADESPGGALMFGSGDGGFLVYSSPFAGTNKATAMAFRVSPEQIDEAIAGLRSSGVTFDTFDTEMGEWEDGVLTQGPLRAVWFRDPDGNILSVAAAVAG